MNASGQQEGQGSGQRAGAWCGVAYVVMLGAALLLAGFVPPPAPSLSAEEVAAMYQSRGGSIRVAMLIAMTSNIFYVPFVAAISAQMRRMNASDFLVHLQLAAGSLGTLMILLPEIGMLVTAFRPERSIELTRTLNDASWLLFATPFPTFVAQNVAIALGIFGDRQARPLCPRWVAYLNLWVALLLMPAGLSFFFKTGPFAWNGLLSFWVAASAFFVWIVVMVAMLFKSARRHD